MNKLIPVILLFAQMASAQTLWTPSNITCAAWYDASDSSKVLTSGSSVTNWLDKSGNGRNAAQATTRLQPTTNSINGLTAISFAASGTNVLVTTFTQLTTASIYLVVDPNSRGTGRNCCPMGAATAFNSGGAYITLQDYGTAVPIHTVYYGPAVTNAYLNGVYQTGNHGFNPCIISHQGTSLATQNLPYRFGCGVTSDSIFELYSGMIGETVICNANHDTATRQKLEGYLAHKWGTTNSLPSNHPYKTNAPLYGDLIGTWTNNASGNWSVSESWSNSIVAMGVGAVAYLGNTITASRTISNSTASIIGSMYAQDVTHDYTIGGSSQMVFSVATGVSVVGVPDSRTLTFSCPLTFSNGLSKIGTGTLAISNIAPVVNGTVQIQAGTLQLHSGTYTQSFSVAGDGTWSRSGSGTLTVIGTNTVATSIISNSTVSANAPLVFSSPNIYLDSLTTVNIVGTNVVADNSTVYIRTGTGGSQIPVIAFGSGAGRVESIRALYIDGVRQAQGTWGASGSGAEYINNDVFSNTNGVINVLPVRALLNGDKTVVIDGRIVEGI